MTVFFLLLLHFFLFFILSVECGCVCVCVDYSVDECICFFCLYIFLIFYYSFHLTICFFDAIWWACSMWNNNKWHFFTFARVKTETATKKITPNRRSSIRTIFTTRKHIELAHILFSFVCVLFFLFYFVSFIFLFHSYLLLKKCLVYATLRNTLIFNLKNGLCASVPNHLYV